MNPSLVVLPHEQGPRIVVFEAAAAEVFDPIGSRLPDLPPARDAVVVDIDGDGVRELLLCGSDGVTVRAWDRTREPSTMSDAPCAKIGVAGDTIVVVGTSAHLFTLPGPVDRGPWGPWLDGEPLLSTGAAGFVVGSSRSTALTGRSAAGKDTIATGAPPLDVALTSTGPVWLLPDRVTDSLFRDREAGPEPRALVPTADHLYVLGADGAVRDLEDGAIVAPGPWRAVTAYDLDGDGCDELVARGESGVAVLQRPACVPSAAEAPIAAPTEPLAAPDAPKQGPERAARVFGLHIPPSLGPDPTDSRPLHWSDRYVGVGGAVASGLPGVWPFVPVFPALTFETVWGGPRIRGLFGVDSSGFLVWVGDSAVLHLLNTTYGVVLGGRDLQFGPIATIGLVDAGIGFRTAFTPVPVQHGAGRMGIETRIIAFAGGAGETDLLWVWRSAGRNERRQLDALGKPLCGSLAFLLGATGGFSSTEGSWQYVGADQPWAPSVSPFAGAACEADGFMLGLETAPTYRWLMPPSRDRVHHMASHTFGPMFDHGDVRFGPIGQIGVWTAGLGGRVAWTGLEDTHGRRQGVDLRAVALFPYAPAWEFTAAWGIWTDPRR